MMKKEEARAKYRKYSSLVYYAFIAFAIVLLLTGNPYTTSGFFAMAVAVAAIILALIGLYVRRKNSERE